MTTFGTLYSGVGGADAGLCAARWTLRWQAEADPFRRDVLRRRFWTGVSDVKISPTVRVLSVPFQRQHYGDVDAIYAELPDSRVDRWWPSVMAASALARSWLLVEFSPTVRCDQILRDLIRDAWSFRMLLLFATIRRGGEPYVRKRALVLAGRSADAVDRLGLAGMLAEIVVSIPDDGPTTPARLAEAHCGLPDDWTCACSAVPCACDQKARRAAATDATSPFVTAWLARLIDGAWRDGLDRGVTAADGSVRNIISGIPT